MWRCTIHTAGKSEFTDWNEQKASKVALGDVLRALLGDFQARGKRVGDGFRSHLWVSYECLTPRKLARCGDVREKAQVAA